MKERDYICRFDFTVVCTSSQIAVVYRFLFSAHCSLLIFPKVTRSREQFIINLVYCTIQYMAYYLLFE